MQYDVIVREEAPGRFSAQAAAVPDVRCEAETEEKAVEMVRQALADRLRSAKVVRIEVPVNGAGPNPWLEFFGHSAGDPTFPDYLEALRRAKEADVVE